MNRFVPIFIVFIAVFVFGNVQLGFAQVQILDGDGKQIAPNEIPPDQTDPPANGRVPQNDPQIFGGNGRSSIIIRKSFSSVDENGDLKTENSGKAIVIGPDGKRQEFDLNNGELNIGPMRIEGLVPGPAAKQQTKSFWLGLQCERIHPAVASQLNLETGLMVSQVPSESPAAAAGIQQYDVLLFADDKQLSRKTDLLRAVKAAGEADTSISLTIIRGGKEMSVTVKPEKRVAGPLKPKRWNRMPNLNLPDLDVEGMFGEGLDARMRLQMEEMEERVRRIQEQLGNGMLEMPSFPLQEAR